MEKKIAKAWLWLMAVVCAGIVAHIIYIGWPITGVIAGGLAVGLVTVWAYVVVSEDF